MSIEHIRESRCVPAKVGGRVRYTGGKDGPREGTIVGGRDGYVQIRLDGEKRAGNYHPTWKLEYLPDSVSVPSAGRVRSVSRGFTGITH
jgi:hypothetical protein